MNEDEIQKTNLIASQNAEAITPDGNIKQTTQPTFKVVEPPKEEEVIPETPEEKDTSLFDAFLQTKGTSEVKPEVKVETKPEVKLEKQPRDYSDLTEEEVPLFRNMSNDAFNKLKPAYLEYKKLKPKLQETENELTKLRTQNVPSVYEHEEGFVLDPAFRQVYSNLNTANQIYNHWKNQLNNVRTGSKDVDILRYNPQTKAYETYKVPSDVNSETYVMEQMTYAQNLVMQHQQQVQGAIAQHKQGYQQNVMPIKEMEQTFFSKFETPENKPLYDPLIQQQLERIPALYRKHPMASLVAKSLVMNAVLAQLLNKAAAAPPLAKVTKQGPSAAEAAAEGNGKSNTSAENVTLDDFKRIKDGY